MSKIGREVADPQKHSDFMCSYHEGGIPVEKSRDNLIEKWVYFADVCGFIFQFSNLDQVKECKTYFEQKVHPSTRSDHPPFERYWHPWYCKLPKGMTKTTKRLKVIKALDQILKKWK